MVKTVSAHNRGRGEGYRNERWTNLRHTTTTADNMARFKKVLRATSAKAPTTYTNIPLCTVTE